MEKEKKSEFTRKISQCNKSGLVLITYEILFSYLEEAEQAYKAEDYPVFKQNIRKAKECLKPLMEALDFRYAVSKELYSLYRFCRDELEVSVIKKDIANLKVVKEILKNLEEAFVEVSKEDHSLPLMQNSQKVIAGMTYQKNNLTETCAIGDESRGFLA